MLGMAARLSALAQSLRPPLLEVGPFPFLPPTVCWSAARVPALGRGNPAYRS
jgi:hypothetical protein